MGLTRWRVVGAVVVGVPLALLLAARLGALQGQAPADLGVTDGRLKPPSTTPNSVSSQAGLYPGHPQQAYASIEPLTLRGSPEQALDRLAVLLRAQPRFRITEQAGVYLRVEAETPWLRFVDDLEFLALPGPQPGTTVVHLRSASRLGRGDLGVNRARIENLRAALAAQENPGAADNREPPLTGY